MSMVPHQATTAVASTPTRKRPRPRARKLRSVVLLSVALCAVSYIILWDNNINVEIARSRRQLAYLDPKSTKTTPYGRSLVDQNYQALVHPSDINSDIFRKQAQGAGGGGYDPAAACDDVLLFLPHSFAHNGHGSQLNNYLLAVLIATFTNRAMVILEPPPALNVFKSNSQFGCPPEAWETRVVRTGAPPKRVGWDFDFPRGLSRLIKHPAWLSRGCPVPCSDIGYEQWDEMRLANNITRVSVPQEIRCRNPPPSSKPRKRRGGNHRNDNKDGGVVLEEEEEEGDKYTNVIVMGGQQIRDYFWPHYKPQMLDRSQPPSLSAAADWALRLGAQKHESRIFAALTDNYQIWDYASALLVRSGILRFQPWIARDVEEHIRINVADELPLDAPYDGIHVRRGDKLESDARTFVRRYWDELGMYDEETGDMPRNYIPFSHYLAQFDDGEACVEDEDEDEASPRLVYVATDDPMEVRREIAEDLPKDMEGNPVLVTANGCNIKFRFVFGRPPSEGDEEASTMAYHIDGDVSKGDCEDRYARNIAGIADLMILAKANIFVGEFNSNWGRLVRAFRLRVNDSTKVTNGARPVLTKGEMRIAWGHRHQGPPGW